MYNIKNKIKERILRFLRPLISGIVDGRLRIVSDQLGWLHYRGMHQSRLNWLRTRVSLNRSIKVKVFFIVTYAAKFGYRSIYDAMEKSGFFEPTIFIVHPRDRFFEEFPSIYVEAQKVYEEFKNRGYRCVFGYDSYGNPLYFERFSPDIIFYNNPYLFLYSHYDNTYINGNYLTCFIPYFMDNSNLLIPERYWLRCGYTSINTSWISFQESYYSHYGFTNTLKKESWPAPRIWSGENAVLAGSPKLDDYTLPKDVEHLPLKLRNGKPIVIYAPHWSIRHAMCLSTFHLFGRKMLEYAKNHEEYNFVFKPHPELASHIKDMNGVGVRDFQKLKGDFDMTPGEYEEYTKEWDSLPNGVYISDGEYIELFRWSSVLITDSGSFIQEYLPSGHPCIYILNPEKANPLSFYGGVGLKILGSYYCCSTWDKIELFLKQLLVEKKDEKKHQRDLILKSDFVNLGSAGKFIVNYITSQLKGEMQ